MCLFASRLAGQESAMLAFAGGALCAILPFVKWSVAFWSMPAVFLFCAVCLMRYPTRKSSLACFALLGHIAVLCPLSLCYFQAWQNMLTAVRIGLAASADVSVAMSLAGPTEATLVASACLIVIATAIVWSLAKEDILAIFFIVPLVLAFKHGFSRQDGHMTAFFGLAAATAAFPCLLWAQSKRLKVVALVSAVIGICGSLLCGMKYQSIPQLTVHQYVENITGITGISKLRKLATLPEFRVSMLRASKENLERSRLPSTWVDLISDAGTPVDSLPAELSVIPANGLKWKPNPALQLFTAYTKELDAIVAAHFASEQSPEFIILSYADVDERSMLFDTPATWRAIFDKYRVILTDQDQRRMLLRRNSRAADVRIRPSVIKRQIIHFGEMIVPPKPQKKEMLLASLVFERTKFGEARKALFRVPPIMLEIWSTGDRRHLVQVTPATAESGLLLGPLILDFDALKDAFNGNFREEVVRFRLVEESSTSYKDQVVCEWRTRQWPTN